MTASASLQGYPAIASYGFLSDCSASALVSLDGAVDWCCLPRMSDDPSFGRLLDWQRGGHCLLAPDPARVTRIERDYEPDTLVLRTHYATETGEVTLQDCLEVPSARSPRRPHRLARRLSCEHGEVDCLVEVAPRFDFGEILPSIDRREAASGCLYAAYGSNKGLMICCDAPLVWCKERKQLHARVRLVAGQSVRLSLRFVDPAELMRNAGGRRDRPADVDLALRRTLSWWRSWAHHTSGLAQTDPQTRRSAFILKGLTDERSGAMAAAATTSLPESPGGERNWDYRYSWVRDTALAVRALHLLGFEREAGQFNAFTERSAAGSAAQLQVMYGLDGKRRLSEVSLDWLEGYRGARPVRVGNLAARQIQHDIYGSLLEVAAVWHDAQRPIPPGYWEFLVSVVDLACTRWTEPDHGIWEFRDQPMHGVHSKVMCWVAVDRGLQLARRHQLPAPLPRWEKTALDMREEIDRLGYDPVAGTYVQVYGEPHLDAALLLLPHFGYIDARDPRMVRTTDAICSRLMRRGLLLRYDRGDGINEREGAFLPCTFWLAECLALQGRWAEAHACYKRALECANDLGLFSEEFAVDGEAGMLGNFPQALTHLAQITAKLALEDMENGAKTKSA